MPIEQLTYVQIAERLGVSTEAARAIVKRHRLPRSRSNDGKTLAAIDLQEIRHKPLPASSPRGHRSVTDVVVTLKARVAELEAELGRAEERVGGVGRRRNLYCCRFVGHRAPNQTLRATSGAANSAGS